MAHPAIPSRPPSPARRSGPRRRPPEPRHALIIESDCDASDVLRRILVAIGFSVSAVDRGVNGIAQARERKPDLIIFDLQLRDVDGPEFVRWVRSSPGLENVPLIAVDALGGGRGLAALGHKILAVLRRPLSADLVREAIRAMPV